MTADPQCIFCRIIAGEIPADVVATGPDTLAFRDINPQAPTHILVIPRRHVSGASEASEIDPTLWSTVLSEATRIAAAEGLTNGYRLVVNSGADGGQTVHHLHVHVLGGRQLGWPPG